MTKYKGAMFVCPKCSGTYFGSHEARGILTRTCHGCSFQWILEDDWMYFKRILSFDSKEEYNRSKQ